MNIGTVMVNFGGVDINYRREWIVDDDGMTWPVEPRWRQTIHFQRPATITPIWILGTGQRGLEAWL